MAYRRCLLQRGKNLIDRRCNPSFTYILHNDDEGKQRNQPDSTGGISNSFTQSSSFGIGSSVYGSIGIFSSSPFAGYNHFCRNMSTTPDHGSDKITVMTDAADVLTDTVVNAVSSQTAPVISEVAIAAADSYYPVQALQYFIDAVHSFTGLNWWAAIVVSTILIRTATIPLLINQLKASTKLSILKPQMEAIKEEMEGKTFDPVASAEGQEKMKKLFKEHGVSPFTPLKGLFISAPVFISFFLAITNMAEKMPSFKHGGAFWFTDLSTPDALYIFPVLTALSFMVVVECNVQEGMEGNSMGNTMKNISRVFALLSVPLTMSFPKAIFCYWVTSNLFSLTYGTVIKVPGVKKTLGIPDLPPPDPTSSPKSPFSFLEEIKKAASAAQAAAAYKAASAANGQSSLPVDSSKQPNKKISSSAADVSQRLKSLEKQVKGKSSEKQVKGRKKNKK